VHKSEEKRETEKKLFWGDRSMAPLLIIVYYKANVIWPRAAMVGRKRLKTILEKQKKIFQSERRDFWARLGA
jgi:hypothetical protein